MVNKIPNRGDIVLLQFNSQTGHEQAGARPALVLTEKGYNEKTGLAIMCPITSSVKGYPFEVTIPSKLKTKGVILADQAKSLDWRIRQIKFIEKAPITSTLEVLNKLKLLLGAAL